MEIIDTHAHIFIPEAFEDVPSKYSNDVPKITNLEKNHVKMKIGDKIINNLPLALFSVNDRLQQMNQENIDMQLLSMYPALFFYNLDAEEANLLIQKHNDAILNLTKDYKGYFMGLGTVPLQDVDKAIKELERIIKLGLVGVEVGSNVNGALLGESKFFPFFETAEKLNALLFVHLSNPIGSTLFLFMFKFSGVMGVVISGETVPTEFRGRGQGTMWAVDWFSNYAIIMIFPLWTAAYGPFTFFILEVILCILAVIYIYKWLPETAGIRVEHMEELFSKKKGASS